MAFSFWDGPQAEATLLKLANDTGRGTLVRVDVSLPSRLSNTRDLPAAVRLPGYSR